jgi:hypothetical protein
MFHQFHIFNRVFYVKSDLSAQIGLLILRRLPVDYLFKHKDHTDF